jgi:ATP-dependent Clp protease, protease subunit
MDANTLCLTYDGPVTDVNVTQFIHRVHQNLGPNISKLYITVNSSGGSVHAGVNLYNFLMSLQVEVITHNVSHVDSSANVIFVAGNKRFADAHSTFLFHGVTLDISGNARLTPTQLSEYLSQVELDEQRIKEIIRARSGINGQRLAAFFKSGRSISAHDAKTDGIIQEIKPFREENGAVRPVWPPLPQQQQ